MRVVFFYIENKLWTLKILHIIYFNDNNTVTPFNMLIEMERIGCTNYYARIWYKLKTNVSAESGLVNNSFQHAMITV